MHSIIGILDTKSETKICHKKIIYHPQENAILLLRKVQEALKIHAELGVMS